MFAPVETLEDVNFYMPDKASTNKIARFFSLFSDNSRVRLLSALAIAPLCVSDLSSILDMNQTTVSHQLKILRDMDAVTYERKGKVLYYRIANSKINDILLIGVEYLGY